MQLEKLVTLMEDNADGLAAQMVVRIRESPRMGAYQRFGDDELDARSRHVYANLGNWLGETSEARMEEEYFGLGRQRYTERIPLSQVVWALLLTRRNLWEFVTSKGSDLQEQLDLELMVVRFFDRAILHAVRGYESAEENPWAS